MLHTLPSLDPFYAEHRRVRDAIGDICAILCHPNPPDMMTFSDLRWQFSRSLLRTLSLKDRLIYPRMREHHDPVARAISAEFEAASAGEYARYAAHLERYPPEWVIRDWHGYTLTCAERMYELELRLAHEEMDLFPWIETAPPVMPIAYAQCKNWARHGWRIRELLGIDRSPIEGPPDALGPEISTRMPTDRAA